MRKEQTELAVRWSEDGEFSRRDELSSNGVEGGKENEGDRLYIKMGVGKASRCLAPA